MERWAQKVARWRMLTMRMHGPTNRFSLDARYMVLVLAAVTVSLLASPVLSQGIGPNRYSNANRGGCGYGRPARDCDHRSRK